MVGFNLINIIINVPITLIALTGHEFAHGWVSTKLGDPTPEREGRLRRAAAHRWDHYRPGMHTLTLSVRC